jgi:Uma2 family endonuclease
MSIALHEPMTLAEFLAWEEHQQSRFEFDGFHPVAMTGGTVAHNRIMRRVHRLLEQQPDGTSCEPFGPDVKIIADGRARYPDAVVSCSPQPDQSQIIEDPIVVFEVLSESTSITDRNEKLREYQATPSILRYVILEQDSIGATVFVRRSNEWSVSTIRLGGVLRMPEIDVEISLDALYTGRTLPAANPASPGS